jgi:hypothetical protein
MDLKLAEEKKKSQNALEEIKNENILLQDRKKQEKLLSDNLIQKYSTERQNFISALKKVKLNFDVINLFFYFIF